MKYNFLLVLVLIFLSCEGTESPDLLPNVPVDFTVDMNLPQYQSLIVPGGTAFDSRQGVQGIYIYNLNNSQFRAFDAACPAQQANSCRPMDLVDNILLTCSCDQNSYSILDGSPQGENNSYYAKEYAVSQINATTLRIRNY